MLDALLRTVLFPLFFVPLFQAHRSWQPGRRCHRIARCPREPLRRTAEVRREAAVAPNGLMSSPKTRSSNVGEEGRLIPIARRRRGCCQLARWHSKRAGGGRGADGWQHKRHLPSAVCARRWSRGRIFPRCPSKSLGNQGSYRRAGTWSRGSLLAFPFRRLRFVTFRPQRESRGRLEAARAWRCVAFLRLFLIFIFFFATYQATGLAEIISPLPSRAMVSCC